MSETTDLMRRELVMAALDRRIAAGADSLTREEISAFPVEGLGSVRLIDTSKGIWNPKELDATLTILSSPDGPYGDEELSPGVWIYHYRAGSKDGDNRKLRRAFELQVPLIMWRKIATAVFVPVYPVYVTGDDERSRTFTVALGEIRYLGPPETMTADARRYAEQIVQRRLHQPEFRGRVLRAYERHCTVCKLESVQLLDAAHIVGDTHALGEATVRNGLAMCKIHHAAYDANLLGISPDKIVHINRELLETIDGPMLEHGLKDMHLKPLMWSPSARADQPDRERLALRFEEFTAAS